MANIIHPQHLHFGMTKELYLFGHKSLLALPAATNTSNKENFLQPIQNATNDMHQRSYLWNHRHTIEDIIRKAMQLSKQDRCTVLEQDQWMNGDFNICVVVEVGTRSITRRVIFRCCKAHRLRGTIDDKIRSEVGAYIWIENKCPDIPVAELIGFELSNGQRVLTFFQRNQYHIY